MVYQSKCMALELLICLAVFASSQRAWAEATLSTEVPAVNQTPKQYPENTGNAANITNSAEAGKWSFHAQTTFISQEHPDFSSKYTLAGTNSLQPAEKAQTSVTATLFLGRSLWKNAEVFINPELAGGSGFSKTTGIAGFPNGEIYRVDDARPKWSISRAYARQFIELGGETEKVESDQNQMARTLDVHRITVAIGKFALNDFFDNNSYAHDPRTQFMNWALMDHGAWDYAADTRGYSWGFYLEVNQASWAIRCAAVEEPKIANGLRMDTSFPTVRADNVEIEYRYALQGHKGIARVLGYNNRARMGSYRRSLNSIDPGVGTPDVTQSRALRNKTGFGINFEQELLSDLGVFFKAAWNDGASETWAFTEIDRSLALGASLNGTRWFRAQDTLGIALLVNGLSQDHANYLEAGGQGFIVGDGALNYTAEEILESYYRLQLSKEFALTGDFQFVDHPAYNRDRGPVNIFSARMHFAY